MLPSKMLYKSKCVTIQIKVVERYFHVVLFNTLYKVILTFKYVDETLVSDHSNERNRAEVLNVAICIFPLLDLSRFLTIISRKVASSAKVHRTLLFTESLLKTYSAVFT